MRANRNDELPREAVSREREVADRVASPSSQGDGSDSAGGRVPILQSPRDADSASHRRSGRAQADAQADVAEWAASPVSAGPDWAGLLGDTRWIELYVDVLTDRPTEASDFTGSLWHGLLGLGLRRTQCVRAGGCDPDRSVHVPGCLYGELFAPRGRPGAGFHGQSTVPAPYVLRALATRAGAGERHRVGVGLCGAVSARIAEVAEALRAGIRDGVGRSRAEAREAGVEVGPPGRVGANGEATLLRDLVAGMPSRGDTLASAAGEGTGKAEPGRGSKAAAVACADVRVSFVTPVRLKRDGRPARDLDYRDLLVGIMRRTSLMAFHHGCRNPGAESWIPPETMLAEAAAVRRRQVHLRWEDAARFSARQQQSMPLGGVVGEIVFAGVPERHHPWLRLGAMLGIGHGASFGLGAMRWKIATEDGAEERGGKRA